MSGGHNYLLFLRILVKLDKKGLDSIKKKIKSDPNRILAMHFSKKMRIQIFVKYTHPSPL